MADLEKTIQDLQQRIARLERSRGAAFRIGVVKETIGLRPAEGSSSLLDVFANNAIFPDSDQVKQGLVLVEYDNREYGPMPVILPVVSWEYATELSLQEIIGVNERLYEPVIRFPEPGHQVAFWWLGGDLYVAIGVTLVDRNRQPETISEE